MELSSIDVISAAAGLASVMVLITVYQAALAKNPMRSRLKHLNARRDALKAGVVTQARRRTPIKKLDSVTLLRDLANRMKLLQTEQTQKLSDMLVQAGYRSKDALAIYQIARLVLPMTLGLLAVMYFYGLGGMVGMKHLHPFFSVAMVFAGLKLPDIYVANQKTKRSKAIQKGLPDALDLMVVCAEAGLTLDAALSRVASELDRASPELSEEFSLTAIELGFLQDRRDALLNLSNRVDLPELRGVVTTLVQAEKYGTPLASSLRVLSSEFRNQRMMRAEAKAAKLPATLTVPLILFILPVLFVVLLGPAACKVVDDFSNSDTLG